MTEFAVFESASWVIPLWLKISHTVFLGVLVPVYWRQYGPANFLWFSDIALFVTLAALWLESGLLASMQAVAVGLLELLWLVDFLVRLATGVHVIGLSTYMFDSKLPPLTRGLSLFHVWLPFLLFWMVWRLGYDARAWAVQSGTAVVVLLVCYLWTDPAENVNWVFGAAENPQRSLPPGIYLILVMALLVFGVYYPTHLLLQTAFPGPETPAGQAGW